MCAVSDSYDWTRGAPAGLNAVIFPRNDGVFGGNRPCAIADIKDGTSNTLAIGEVTGAGPGSLWGEIWIGENLLDTKDGINHPVLTVPGGGTFPFNPCDAAFSSYHPGGCHFTMADGSVSFLSQNIPRNLLISLTTRDGAQFHSYSTTATSDPVLVSGPP
jgi:prepilin-type processing-associated H-X9-DG protein